MTTKEQERQAIEKDQKDRGGTRRKQLRRIRDGGSSGTGRG